MPAVNLFPVVAKLAAKDIVRGRPGAGVEAALSLVEQTPDALNILTDLLADESRRKKPDRSLTAAYALMFGHGLENLRYGVERRIAAALHQADALRDRLLTMGRDGAFSPETLAIILAQYDTAELDPGDDLRALTMALLGEDAAADTALANESPPEALLRQLAEVAAAMGDEFELFEQLTGFAAPFSDEQRAGFAALTFAPSVARLFEASVGWLLDPAAAVRAVIPALFQDRHRPRISGVMLRRLIMLRNWAPPADRPALDNAVKVSRKRGVAVTPLADRAVEDSFVSGWDGSGTQSLFILVKEGRKFAVASVLLKLEIGVRDAWVRRGLTKRQAMDMLGEVGGQIGLMPGAMSYAAVAIGHALTLNAECGAPPPFGLLDVVEAAGLAHVRPEAMTVESLLADMVSPTDAAALRYALHGSRLWHEMFPFAGSWFEDGAAVEAAMGRRRTASAAAVKAVFEQVLESRRRVWAERFLRTALTLRMISDPSGCWREMAIIANELLNARPLRDIPVMVNIAHLTVEAHLARRLWGA